jgi:hypothetical protein
MDRGPAQSLGIGRALVFWIGQDPHGAGRPAVSWPGHAGIFRQAGPALPSAGRWPFLWMIPFKNRRFLPSAALRRGDDFGMVPPI